jgi:hypothetical protein
MCRADSSDSEFPRVPPMEIEMNTTQSLLIAAALTTAASLSFARTETAPGTGTGASAKPAAAATAQPVSKAPHAKKRHKPAARHAGTPSAPAAVK